MSSPYYDDYGCRVFCPKGAVQVSTFLLIDGTAYFVYLGYVRPGITIKHVEFYVSTGGTGAQTAEVGIFSTPSAPSKAGQSLTKLAASGSLDSLTSTGVKRNTASLAYALTASKHLWAGIRTAMATNEPTLGGLANDNGQGHILSLAAAGALTAAGPFAGGLITAAAPGTSQAPALRVVLD